MVNDVLYIAVANVVPDPKDQHWSQEGFVQAFNARDLRERLAVFQTTPSGRKGGIWQGGRGIATDGLGNIYLSTAGRYYDGVRNFGSSTLKFAGPSLKLADWFTPNNHEFLFLQNIDMSAGGVTLIPNSPLMFSGGKEGVIFLLNRDDMGKLESATGGPLQRFQAGHGCGQKDCAQTLGTAFWRRQNDGVLYVWDRRDVLRAYNFVNNRFLTTPAAVSTAQPGMTGGPSVSANGSDVGSGIVWAATTQSTRSGGQAAGTLRAFRASDVSQEIYNSDLNSARDALGDFRTLERGLPGRTIRTPSRSPSPTPLRTPSARRSILPWTTSRPAPRSGLRQALPLPRHSHSRRLRMRFASMPAF